MASVQKKRRIECEDEWLEAILQVCIGLNEAHVTLTPLRIECCNAIASCAPSFPKAFCDTKPYDAHFYFADVFHKGLKVLRYFEDGNVPNDKQTLHVFNKLMDFLKGDRSIPLSDPLKLQSLSETEWTVLVANHLLQKLAPSSCYLIDKNYNGKRGDGCFCDEEACKITGSYGDTSIGNPEVWHGNLKIIINDKVAVEPLDDQPETSGGISPVEKKLKALLKKTSQIMAQTIVFSFLQKKRHPGREHFLIPCIGLGNSELKVILYDSEHDILLESSTIPLFRKDSPCQFSCCAILVCWLTVNYQYFCSGMVEEYKGFKSNFFEIAKEKITVYEEKLQFQNVTSNRFPELKLKNLPQKENKPYVSPFLKETQLVFLRKYVRSQGSKDEEN